MTPTQLEQQRIRRKKQGNSVTKKYEKTPQGFLMRLYRNMKSRVDGVQHQKHHLYRGLSLLDKQVFYSWALGCNEFWILYNTWVARGCPRKLAPSVDRVNPKVGYELANMEWVTMGENSRRGSVSKYRSTISN